MNIVFDDGSITTMQIIASTSDEGHNNTSKNQEDVADENQSDSDTNISEEESDEEAEPIQVHKNHSAGDVIGDLNGDRVTRGVKLDLKQRASFACFEKIMFSCFV